MCRIYLYIIVMAAITYLIRVLPFLLLRRKIRNRFVRSFLYYVPYATLAAMTFPAVLYATGNLLAGAVAFIVAAVLAWQKKSLLAVSAFACAAAFILELVTACIPGGA